MHKTFVSSVFSKVTIHPGGDSSVGPFSDTGGIHENMSKEEPIPDHSGGRTKY